MATKKLINQNDFFKQKMAAAGKEIQESQTEQSKSMQAYVDRMHKERVNIDVDLFDDAPKEWNFFPPLAEDKMLQLKLSIQNNGIMDPVIAWQQENGRYMILAGHNRIHACRQIIQEYAGLDLRRDYRQIPTIIYGVDEIDESKAREVIIDTNYLQRGELTPRLRVSVIRARVGLMRGQRDERGAKINELIQNLNLKKSTVYDDIKIGTQVIPPLQNLYFDGRINRRAVLKFTQYSEEIQQWIFTTYGESLTSERICLLSKRVKLKGEIASILGASDEVVLNVHTQVTVPQNKLAAFRKLSTIYLTDPEFEELCNHYIQSHYPEDDESV